MRKVSILTKKLEPIAPRPSIIRRKILKNTGNSVEDKRKVLEMELEKLKQQVKKQSQAAPRSYPSPTSLKAERESKDKDGIAVVKKDNIVYISLPSAIVTVGQTDAFDAEENVQEVSEDHEGHEDDDDVAESPTYILYQEEDLENEETIVIKDGYDGLYLLPE